MLAIAELWKVAGFAAETVNIPAQRQEDREYRATFPALSMQRGSYGVTASLAHSSEAPLPTNDWAGKSLGRYLNPEFDVLIDRLATTIPVQERVPIWGSILHMVTDQLIVLPLFYDVNTTVANRRLKNVTGIQPSSTDTWNAELWDLDA